MKKEAVLKAIQFKANVKKEFKQKIENKKHICVFCRDEFRAENEYPGGWLAYGQIFAHKNYKLRMAMLCPSCAETVKSFFLKQIEKHKKEL